MADSKPTIQTFQTITSQILEKNPLKRCPKMGRNGVKMRTIYTKLYVSIFIRQNFSHPPKDFLSQTLYVELRKNMAICFKGNLASC